MGAARLPFALKQAGFEVGAVCPDGSYLSGTNYTDYKLPYNKSADRTERYKILQRAFHEWPCDLVIPGDEIAVWFLRIACTKAEGVIEAPYLNLISQSLCNLEHRRTIEQNTVLGAIADGLGLDSPARLISPSLEEAVAFAERHGFPVVLKRDYTYAGLGVSICRNLKELRVAYAAVAEKARVEQDGFSLQRFIVGSPASVSFSALNGKLLAAFAFRAERTWKEPGVTSIVRNIDNKAMINAADKLVAYFGFTGFGGVDFMLDDSNRPWLLEINPRPTPTTHLGSLVGVDLCAELYAVMLGKESPTIVLGKRVDRVAMFPFAWMMGKHTISEFSGHHDVPWYDPPQLAMMIRDFWGKCRD